MNNGEHSVYILGILKINIKPTNTTDKLMNKLYIEVSIVIGGTPSSLDGLFHGTSVNGKYTIISSYCGWLRDPPVDKMLNIPLESIRGLQHVSTITVQEQPITG